MLWTIAFAILIATAIVWVFWKFGIILGVVALAGVYVIALVHSLFESPD